ncbi:MAG: transposase [Deltaproteobacteria bacterium]|nr:transposase [Deltaproteobacteria bacterium]
MSPLVRLSTERVWQEAVEEEQAQAVGRERYERRTSERGYRNGYENGALKTAEGGLGVEVPPTAPTSRGRRCLGLVVLFRYLALHEGEPPPGNLYPHTHAPAGRTPPRSR